MNASDIAKVSQIVNEMVGRLQTSSTLQKTIQITKGTVEVTMIKREPIEEAGSKQQELLLG